MTKAKEMMGERALTLYAISKLREEDSAARIQIYDYIFERLEANLNEGTHRPETVIELQLLLAEAAIKFDF